ncbi:MAG: alpha-glucuronidase, partial [Acidobacteria bacterium]
MVRMNNYRRRCLRACLFTAVLLCATSASFAEDGYRLWLRYDSLPESAAKQYREKIQSIVVAGDSGTSAAIRSELTSALTGLLGKAPKVSPSPMSNGLLLVGTPSSSSLIKNLRWENELYKLGTEGYIIRSTRIGPHSAIVIASQTDAGTLYGTFHFLRLMQTLQPIVNLNVTEQPRLRL